MIHDKVPEITEDFTLTVIKADGTKSVKSYDQDKPGGAKPVISEVQVSTSPDGKLDALVKEILNERRRKD